MNIEEKIGENIKNLRKQNGLTQEELADRTELTKSFISLLERGQTAPSVSTLECIVECLGTNLSDFFREDDDQVLVYEQSEYFEKVDKEGNITKWLVPTAQSHNMEPILMTIQPGAELQYDSPHEGEEFGYVIEGAVTLEYGDRKDIVKEGDSFMYTADKKHRLVSASDKVTKVLWISSPPSF